MGKSTASSGDILKLIYNATAIANIADNTVTSPLTNIFVALHTADPGVGGTQATSEATYTGYARATVARTTGGWTVTGNSASPVSNIGFGACTAGSNTVLFWSTGAAVSGASKIFHSGVIGTSVGAFTGAVSGNVITIPASGLAVNDPVVFYAVSGSTLPGGLTGGTIYYVITASTDTITVSATVGGSAVTLTTSGDGIAFKDPGIAVTAGVTPQLTTATVIIES